METIRLKQFCIIAETGSISKASELLHITHSGLSKAMKTLQEELAINLFRAEGRGLALTEDGKRVYQNAKSFLELERRLFHAPMQDQSTSIKIGTVEIFLPSLCESINDLDDDGHSITLLDLNPGQIEHMISNHEIDYGITYIPIPMDTIEIIPVGSYQLGCYHLSGVFSDQDFCEIPFAVPSVSIPVNSFGIKERDGWVESIISRNRKYFVNLLSTGIELTLQGLCALYIPSFVASHINKRQKACEKLIEKSMPKALRNTQQVFIVKHKDQLMNNTFTQLEKVIRNFISKNT